MLKIVVNSHIRKLIERYKNVIEFYKHNLQDHKSSLVNCEREILLLRREVEELRHFKVQVMRAECTYDRQFEHVTMAYRINKWALKSARYPELLFELGWQDMVKQIMKVRHEN